MADTTEKSGSMMVPALLVGGVVLGIIIYFAFIKKSAPTPRLSTTTGPATTGAPSSAALATAAGQTAAGLTSLITQVAK